MTIKAYRTLPKLTITPNDKIDPAVLRTLEALMEQERSGQWKTLTRSLEAMAHDLDQDCPCGTCNVVRNIAARYT